MTAAELAERDFRELTLCKSTLALVYDFYRDTLDRNTSSIIHQMLHEGSMEAANQNTMAAFTTWINRTRTELSEVIP